VKNRKTRNNIKVLMICGSFPPMKCGVGDYTSRLAESLADNGTEVTVLTSDKSMTSKYERKYNIKNCISKWNGISLLKSVLKEAVKGYDIVHIQFPSIIYTDSKINWLLPLFLRFIGKKVIYTFHEYYNSSSRLPAVVFSNQIIVVDKFFEQEINRQYKYLMNKKINLIKIGSNIPKSNLSNEKRVNLRRNILENKNCADGISKIISYFGFMNSNKKIELILKAMGDLKRKEKLYSLFMIIGDFYAVNKDMQIYQQQLKEIIKNEKLEKYVYITGFQQDNCVGDFLCASDAAVLLFDNGVSARNGSFLAAIQENIPVITTKPRILDFYGEGVFFINNSIDEIQECILKLQDDILLDNVHIDRKTISWDEIAKKHISVYNKTRGAV
jgi:glycosyltransferase involved in cell wall biosynthesis